MKKDNLNYSPVEVQLERLTVKLMKLLKEVDETVLKFNPSDKYVKRTVESIIAIRGLEDMETCINNFIYSATMSAETFVLDEERRVGNMIGVIQALEKIAGCRVFTRERVLEILASATLRTGTRLVEEAKAMFVDPEELERKRAPHVLGVGLANLHSAQGYMVLKTDIADLHREIAELSN